MAMSVYAGTTLIEAQKIIAGDYSVFDWRERVPYRRVYLGIDSAIRDAENAPRHRHRQTGRRRTAAQIREDAYQRPSQASQCHQKLHELYRTRNSSNGQAISSITKN